MFFIFIVLWQRAPSGLHHIIDIHEEPGYQMRTDFWCGSRGVVPPEGKVRRKSASAISDLQVRSSGVEMITSLTRFFIVLVIYVAESQPTPSVLMCECRADDERQMWVLSDSKTGKNTTVQNTLNNTLCLTFAIDLLILGRCTSPFDRFSFGGKALPNIQWLGTGSITGETYNFLQWISPSVGSQVTFGKENDGPSQVTIYYTG